MKYMTCRMPREDEKCTQNLDQKGKRRQTILSEDTGVGLQDNNKIYVKKEGVKLWNGIHCLRAGCCSGFLQTWY
jgi:hypothetical protein